MELKDLAQQIAEVATKAQAIQTQFTGKEMPADKRAELSKLVSAGLELKAKFDAAKAEAETAKDLAALTAFQSRPVPTAPLPTGPGSEVEGTKELAKRGWELKAGMWHAPTSLGLQPMYPSDVLFGKIEAATPGEMKFVDGARIGVQPRYSGVFKRYIQAVLKTGSENRGLQVMEGWEQKDLTEGSDPGGGFLVPPEYQAEMLIRTAAFAVVRQAGARVQQCTRDQLRYPMANAASATADGLGSGGDSIFAGGFIGAWAGENPAFTSTDPAFGLFAVPVKKVRVATKLSLEFVADSAVDILAFLSRNGAENMALVEDHGFLTGDGSALKPKGIINNGATGVGIAGSVAHTISNSSSNTGSAPLLKSLWAALPPQYDQKAVFIMSKGSEGAVRKLVDANNRYLWPEYMGSGLAAPGDAKTVLDKRQLEGRPVLNSQFLPDGSSAQAASTVAIIYGDISNYLIAQRAQITTVVLRERFADTDQLGIILWERVGGDTWNVDSLRFGTL